MRWTRLVPVGVRNHPPNTPELFTAAWQHIWNIFKGPMASARRMSLPVEPLIPAFCGEPVSGDAYVDYVGFTAFNWGPPKKRTGSRCGPCTGSVEPAVQDAPTKPIIVAETGSTTLGGKRTGWIAPAIRRCMPRSRWSR